MSELWIEVEGPEGLVAVFNEDEGAGYLSVFEPRTDEIRASVLVYSRAENVLVEERDVEVSWSCDFSKCGVVIWGQMRAVIDLANGQELTKPLHNRASRGITEPAWLRGFEDYLDDYVFVRSRQHYWKRMVERYEQGEAALPDEETPVNTNFIVHERGYARQFGVFEDEGATGYLYLWDGSDEKVLKHIHIYDRRGGLEIAAGDVEVLWSRDKTKLGVAIWGRMRGIIDLVSDKEGRVWLESPETPGIGDPEWLSGF